MSPLEAYWHGEFLLSSNLIDFKVCEPIFKCFNYYFEYNFYRKNGLTEKDLAKNYLGIVMQDGWIKDKTYRPRLFYRLAKKIEHIKFYLHMEKRYAKTLSTRKKIRFYIKFYTTRLIKEIFK